MYYSDFFDNSNVNFVLDSATCADQSNSGIKEPE